MKLPNLGKVKMPKPGGLKINNRFLKRHLLSLIVVAVLAAGTGTVYGTLSSHAADKGHDPVNGINKDRYQVLVSGDGYKLSKKQEKDYKLQKKQNKINAENAARNPNTLRPFSGSRVFRSGSSSHFRYRGHSFKTSKAPRITSDVSSEISKLEKPVAGDTFKIRVSARAYPFRTKNSIDSDDIKVSVVGGSATLYKSDGGNHYYKIELGEGTNKITITATDKKTKKKATLGPYTVKVSAGNSGGSNTDPSQNTDPSESETPVTKEVSVTVNYGSDGSNSLSKEVDETITVREALSQMGVTVNSDTIEFVPGSFSISSFDDELEDIYKEEKADELNEDGSIDSAKYDAWKEDIKDKIKDGMGKDHPFSSTHWECGTSLDTTVKDLTSGITLTLHLY